MEDLLSYVVIQLYKTAVVSLSLSITLYAELFTLSLLIQLHSIRRRKTVKIGSEYINFEIFLEDTISLLDCQQLLNLVTVQSLKIQLLVHIPYILLTFPVSSSPAKNISRLATFKINFTFFPFSFYQ